MQFLGINNIAIANHISCLIDGLMLQRIFAPDLVDFEEQINLLARILAEYLEN